MKRLAILLVLLACALAAQARAYDETGVLRTPTPGVTVTGPVNWIPTDTPTPLATWTPLPTYTPAPSYTPEPPIVVTATPQPVTGILYLPVVMGHKRTCPWCW